MKNSSQIVTVFLNAVQTKPVLPIRAVPLPKLPTFSKGFLQVPVLYFAKETTAKHYQMAVPPHSGRMKWQVTVPHKNHLLRLLAYLLDSSYVKLHVLSCFIYWKIVQEQVDQFIVRKCILAVCCDHFNQPFCCDLCFCIVSDIDKAVYIILWKLRSSLSENSKLCELLEMFCVTKDILVFVSNHYENW